jgi:hypothetical protein
MLLWSLSVQLLSFAAVHENGNGWLFWFARVAPELLRICLRP